MAKHPLLNIAINAALDAGKMISMALERLDTVNVQEKNPHDFVTDVDHRSEKIIIETIHKSYPEHAIFAEESGLQNNNHHKNQHDITWIIDPLDGTHNFMHGLPHFCISIAIQQAGRIEHAVVYDPIRQDLFTASKGGGAQHNDRRIRVSKRTQLDGALLGTAFPWSQRKTLQGYLAQTHQLLENHRPKVRCTGSAALDLAYVAAGYLDGFWELDLQAWDMAAGALLVKEAGGLVSDFQGGESFLENGNIVAAPPKIFKALLRGLNQ